MRIDHHAYQQATRVAATGFLVQAVLGLILLVFGLVSKDRPFIFASLPILIGLLPWGGLAALFHQHRLERLEALEEDELSAGRADAASVFDAADEEIRVAARRLRRMHQIFMPALSIVIVLTFVVVGIMMVLDAAQLDREEAPFVLTEARGWAVSLALAFAGVAFIFSRFVAGMAKQGVWQNLRGGAAAMVGVSVVTVAVAIGIIARFFDNDTLIQGITEAIPWYMFVLAAEITLNFILNVYRPRIPGDVPRPAFDSKLLSLVAAPDNIVRTVNDAVNYQFGFDITSSWGYQLLVRSFTGLAVTGVVVVLGLSMMVIVQPGEQAIRLARGSLVSEEPVASGVMIKAPWPVQTAERFEVSGVRELPLTATMARGREPEVQLFSDDLDSLYSRPLDPFIVRANRGADGTPATDSEGRPLQSLVDAEIRLQYRIDEDGGLMEHLDFVPANQRRRGQLDERRSALRALALREVTTYLATLTLNEVLNTGRLELAAALRDNIQAAFDGADTGIDVTAVTIPLLRPHGKAAGEWEEFSVARQRRQQAVLDGERTVATGYAGLIGDSENVEAAIAAITTYNDAVAEFGPNAEATLAAREAAEVLVLASGGEAAARITDAVSSRIITVLDARGESARIEGQSRSYRAAPELFRVLEEMAVWARALPGLRKYVIAIDPERVDIDYEFVSLDPLTAIADALGDSSTDEEGGQ